ncbi:C-C motif chemokine 19-like [Pelobates fuscus]|uniref:C-C motif chemokine 19-like n=1 Tax=Pelobates fuscus TaxID=191477 RepID=UPI002FE47A6C
MALHMSLIFLIMVSIWAASEVYGRNTDINDCCLDVKNIQIPAKRVKAYYMQDGTNGCNIKALVFITRKNRHLCAPHNVDWAIKLKNMIEGRNIRKKRHNHNVCESAA